MNFEELISIILADIRERNVYYSELRKAALALNEKYEPNRYGDEKFDPKTADKAELTDYRKLMGRLMDSCRIYLSHCNEDSPTGKGSGYDTDRKKLAKGIIKTLDPEYTSILRAEQKIYEGNIPAIRKLQDEIDDRNAEAAQRPKLSSAEKIKKLDQISMLQRNIGGSGIVPKEKVFSAKPSRASEIWASFRNKLTKVLSAFSVIGNLAWGVTALLTRSNIQKKKEELRGVTFDPTRVPGSKKDHFERSETLREKIDAMGPDQPVLNEKKRIPMVYERPVPGDPSAKPTITLKVLEIKDGSDVEYSSSNGMGHAFITLQYTKNDPLTGKPQRYETSFGFYPKGGYESKGFSVESAMYQKGMYVPGQLNHDIKHPYSVAKTFEIDNQKVNRTLLAAQDYEKEGYSFYDRNCTTFLHDMAIEAGIPADDFIKECPIKSEGTAGQDILGFLAGNAAANKGVSVMLSTAGKDDYSYQRIGQKMLNEEVAKKLDKMSYRKELKGYAPAHVAETMRAEKGLKLDTAIDVEWETVDGKTVDIKQQFGNILGTIGLYKNLLFRELDSFARDNDLPELEKVNMNLRNYISTRAEIVRQYEDSMFYDHYSEEKKEKIYKKNVTEQLKSINECMKSIDETVDALNEMYQTTYKQHPDMNVSFRNVIGAFNAVKLELSNHAYHSKRRLEYSEVNGKIKRNDNVRDEDYANVIDPSLDCAKELKKIFYEVNSYRLIKEGSVENVKDNWLRSNVPVEFAAGIKTFGSIQNYIKYGLNSDGAIELPEKEAHTLELKSMGLYDFRRSMESWANTEKLYPSDYSFAFSVLPAEEKKHIKKNTCTKLPSDSFKKIALEHAFGMKTNVLKSVGKNGKKLEYDVVERNGLKKALSEMKGDARDFKEKIDQILSENIEGNKSFASMKSAFIESAMQKKEYDPKKESPLVYQANLRFAVHSRMMKAMKENYLSDVMADAAKINRGMPAASQIDFYNDPAFERFRKAIFKESGIDMDMIRERDACYEKLDGMYFRGTLDSPEAKELVAKILVIGASSELSMPAKMDKETLTEQSRKFARIPGFENLVTEKKVKELLDDYKNADNDEIIVTAKESAAVAEMQRIRAREAGEGNRLIPAAGTVEHVKNDEVVNDRQGPASGFGK